MKTARADLVPILAKLSDKLPPKRLAEEVAGFLLDNKLTGELDSLARDLVSYRAQKGVVEVTAISARALPPAALSEIKQKVKQIYPNASRIIVNQRLDAEQIGGVRLELPGQQLDLTVLAKLNQFKRMTAGN